MDGGTRTASAAVWSAMRGGRGVAATDADTCGRPVLAVLRDDRLDAKGEQTCYCRGSLTAIDEGADHLELTSTRHGGLSFSNLSTRSWCNTECFSTFTVAKISGTQDPTWASTSESSPPSDARPSPSTGVAGLAESRGHSPQLNKKGSPPDKPARHSGREAPLRRARLPPGEPVCVVSPDQNVVVLTCRLGEVTVMSSEFDDGSSAAAEAERLRPGWWQKPGVDKGRH